MGHLGAECQPNSSILCFQLYEIDLRQLLSIYRKPKNTGCRLPCVYKM